MKKVQDKIFEVNLSYHLQAEDATKALDQVLSCSPCKPLAFSVELVGSEEEDDD